MLNVIISKLFQMDYLKDSS